MILGCQRSGTTLLGMALQAHHAIELIEENNPNFHIKSASSPIHIDLHAVSTYTPADRRVTGFKAPRDSHRIDEIFESVTDIRVIWIWREIRQVVASMVSLRMPSGSLWANSFAHEEIIKYLSVEKSDYEIAGLYKQALALNDEREAGVTLASLCWFAKHRTQTKSCATWPESIHPVSYNDLVFYPENTLAQLLDFLDIKWDPSVLNHTAMLTGDRPGGTPTNRPIDIASVSKWASQLTERDLQLITDIKETLDRT